ncbi:MAG: hypothetical protein EOO38_11655 [Cytophagaceae bacterium]|nr:MAG: hypothetical protein EOO38_11655 [Cytophagaceae bacterium]
MKRFLLGTARLALALIVALAVLGIAGAGIYHWRQESVAAPLRVAKHWPDRKLVEVDPSILLKLSTRWSEYNNVHYKFALVYPRGGVKFLDEKRPSAPSFVVELLDKDGFRIAIAPIEEGRFHETVDSEGRITGWEAFTDSYLPPEEYAKVAGWSARLGIR